MDTIWFQIFSLKIEPKTWKNLHWLRRPEMWLSLWGTTHWWEDWTRISLQIRANYQMAGNWKSRVLSQPNISERLGLGFVLKDYAAYLQLLEDNDNFDIHRIGPLNYYERKGRLDMSSIFTHGLFLFSCTLEYQKVWQSKHEHPK